MAKLMPTGKQQYFDASGNPLSGGKVYTFDAGTSTPKATYSDAAGTVPNANPVILNSRGEALIFWDGVYDVQVKDVNDNLIYTVPNYSAQNEASSVSYGGNSLDSLLKDSIGRVVSSVSALRAIDKTKNTKVLVSGYYASGDGGGGFYYYDAADTASADNGGTIIVATDGGRWKLIVKTYVSIRQFGANGTAGDAARIQNALDYGYTTGIEVYADPGTYLIDATLIVRRGQRVVGANGRITGSYAKTVFKATAALNPIIDISEMKHGYIGGISLHGEALAVTGTRGTNVFGAVIENMRAEEFTSNGFELKNDGTGIGCYGNTYRNCAANDCVNAGFEQKSTSSDINLIVYDTCVATDCAYGFLESGTFGGRNSNYINCNAERCSVRGMEITSTGFRIEGGYFEFNNTNILIDNANITEQQGGYIGGCTFLGSYGFSGAPNAYLTVGINVNSSYNVTIDSCWFAYCKTGITIASTSKWTDIRNPFYNSSNVETFLSESASGLGTSVTKGGQKSQRVRGSAANITATPEYGEIIYSDCGNNNLTLSLNITNYELGMGHEVMTLMSSGNTGSLTISDSTGATFFGQLGGTRQNNTASLVLSRGDVVKLRKQSATSWFVMCMNAIN